MTLAPFCRKCGCYSTQGRCWCTQEAHLLIKVGTIVTGAGFAAGTKIISLHTDCGMDGRYTVNEDKELLKANRVKWGLDTPKLDMDLEAINIAQAIANSK